MKILGAGMAGCLAALLIPGSTILEPMESIKIHQALLRFRSDRIGKALGIPFKKVIVHKGIWHNDKPVQLSPKYIIRYARKVSPQITARSIINLDPVERWIAPDDFHHQMLDMLQGRIVCKADIRGEICSDQIISTLPLFVVEELIYNTKNEIAKTYFDSIYVSKYKIIDCDIHVTNYYTGTNTGVYRASISGSDLIIESTFKIGKNDIEIIRQSFGLDGIPIAPIIENFVQTIGKIHPIDEKLRKKRIYELTKNHGIYSLGRFATWRNIVMDDVYNDILRIKEWIHMSDYERIVK